jgi:short-subunit dehydrogenase
MVFAALRLSHGVLPGMVDRGWGRIINMSSIAGLFTGFPTDITYNAIKGMLERFSEGIDGEYRELGIRCTVSMPGPTRTEIFEQPNSSANVGASWLFAPFEMTPEHVARRTYAAVMKGKPMIVPGPHNAALAVVLQYGPRRVRRRLSDTLCRLTMED